MNRTPEPTKVKNKQAKRLCTRDNSHVNINITRVGAENVKNKLKQELQSTAKHCETQALQGELFTES